MENTFTFEKRDDGIGILYFDLQGEKVNKFSTPVIEELERKIEQLKKEDLKCLLIISKKKKIFIAGADINEIKGITDPELGYQIGLKGQKVLANFSKDFFFILLCKGNIQQSEPSKAG